MQTSVCSLSAEEQECSSHNLQQVLTRYLKTSEDQCGDSDLHPPPLNVSLTLTWETLEIHLIICGYQLRTRALSRRLWFLLRADRHVAYWKRVYSLNWERTRVWTGRHLLAGAASYDWTTGRLDREDSWFLCIPEALWNIPAALLTFTQSASPSRPQALSAALCYYYLFLVFKKFGEEGVSQVVYTGCTVSNFFFHSNTFLLSSADRHDKKCVLILVPLVVQCYL